MTYEEFARSVVLKEPTTGMLSIHPGEREYEVAFTACARGILERPLCDDEDFVRHFADRLTRQLYQEVIADAGSEHLRYENDLLRELALLFAEYVGQDRCEGCVYKSRCNEGLMSECVMLGEIRAKAERLGIEVDT